MIKTAELAHCKGSVSTYNQIIRVVLGTDIFTLLYKLTYYVHQVSTMLFSFYGADNVAAENVLLQVLL